MAQDPKDKNAPALRPATTQRRAAQTERLAAALRENLKRRKAQQRLRDKEKE